MSNFFSSFIFNLFKTTNLEFFIAHAAGMHQVGSSRPSSQIGPPQHEFGPPGHTTPYHSGYVTYDGAIFELRKNPFTGKAVNIRPQGVDDNWVPIQD